MNELRAPNLSAKIPITLGLVIIFLLFGGMAVWAAMFQISGAVIAKGRVDVEQNRQVIQASIDGIVDYVAIREGSRVITGDVLLQLDATRLIAEKKLADAQYFEGLAERALVRAELEGANSIIFDQTLVNESLSNSNARAAMNAQRRLWQMRQQSIIEEWNRSEEQLAQIKAESAGFRARHLALTEQLRVVAVDLKDRKSLFERGLAGALPLRALQKEQARLRGALGQIDADIVQTIARMNELKIEKRRRENERLENSQNKLNDLRRSGEVFGQHRIDLRARIEQMTVRAPVSGVVHELRIHSKRAVIERAEPLMFLVPQDRPLLVTARVDPKYIGQLVSGQTVTMRLDIENRSEIPSLTGRLQQISADVIEERHTGRWFYNVEIKVNGDQPAADFLRLGMPVDVFFTTRPRSPLAYLIEPMTDYLARAMREN
jgi:HlyD family secretion protein